MRDSCVSLFLEIAGSLLFFYHRSVHTCSSFFALIGENTAVFPFFSSMAYPLQSCSVSRIGQLIFRPETKRNICWLLQHIFIWCSGQSGTNFFPYHCLVCVWFHPTSIWSISADTLFLTWAFACCYDSDLWGYSAFISLLIFPLSVLFLSPCNNTYIQIHVHTHIYIYIYIYIYTHTHTYIYIYKYIHTHTHTYLNTSICTHTHTHIYKHISTQSATLKFSNNLFLN